MSLDELLNGLNAEQREAVTAPAGPTLVVAGPGSGKTSVLTRRVAYLIDHLGVPAYHILAVTFTNKAAKEMQERIARLVGDTNGLTVGTFHAICARILRREISALPGYTGDYTIYDTDDQVALIRACMSELDIDSKRNPPYGQLNKISAAKNELITPAQYIASIPPEKITQKIYMRYQQALRTNNALDFDDLIMLPVLLFQQNLDILARYQAKYEFVLVDEFQDTNTAQYQLLRHLGGGAGNLFVVGDPDQSIYRFRGAVPKNVQQFRTDYEPVHLIRLGQNYRSHQLILDAATAVIRKNADHIPITLTGQRKDGAKIILRDFLTEDQEARYIVDSIAEYVRRGRQPRDCAVMYRVNAQSRGLEEAFVRAGLPYRLVGGVRFYGRKEIKDVLAYLRLVYNPDDSVSFRRVVNIPPRGLGDKTIDQLETLAAKRRESMYRTLTAYVEGLISSVDAPFAARAEKSLKAFAELLTEWVTARDQLSASDLLESVISRIRYMDYLNDGSDEAVERIENLTALRNVARDYGDRPLSDFLEEVALVAEVDTQDANANAPTLLTLHAAKGLDFSVVFIAGLEEGTLPHQRSLSEDDEMAEERRLLYVGITRAKDVLHLTWTARRALYGSNDYLMPSRFLMELPRALLDGVLPTKAVAQGDWRNFREATTWSSGSGGGRELGEAGERTFVQPINGRPPRSEPTAQPTVFKSGQRIVHDRFGEGMVITSTIRGGVEELEVRFMNKQYGFKKLSAEYVKLA